MTTLLGKSDPLHSHEHAALSRRYLAFLWFSFHEKTGRFRNFLSYDRKWQEETGSEDSHSRALWALGTVFCHSEESLGSARSPPPFIGTPTTRIGMRKREDWSVVLSSGAIGAHLECRNNKVLQEHCASCQPSAMCCLQNKDEQNRPESC